MGTLHFVTCKHNTQTCPTGLDFLYAIAKNLQKTHEKIPYQNMETKKNAFIKFRITGNEKKVILQRAQTSEKSLSEFSRFMLTNGEVINISKEERKILAGLANNINQLVKLFHQSKIQPKGLLDELTITLKHLRNAYRRSS